MLKNLFDKCVKLAASKFASYGLALVAFCESSFFPVPPDIMIVPMVVAKKEKFQSNAGTFSWMLILFTAAFTPLPFKLVTIFSGFIQFNLILFFLVCLFARGLRFFIVAYLSFRFGSTFSIFLEKKGSLWATIIGLAIVVIALIIYLIIKFYV